MVTCALCDRDGTELSELERQKDEFLANVSHELRTPIATVKTLFDVLLSGQVISPSAEAQLLVGNMQRELERMETLVDELLELGRLQAGFVRLRAAPCDVREVVHRAAVAIEPLAGKRRQVIHLSLPDEPVVATVDAARLERALLNLLSNAHKYSFEGTPIRLALERTATEVVVSVGDQGPGIPEADQERVFQRFYRSPLAAVRRVQGSGLGLPITRGLVELHGGHVSVESPAGAGAVFRIHLPLGDVPSLDNEDLGDDRLAG